MPGGAARGRRPVLHCEQQTSSDQLREPQIKSVHFQDAFYTMQVKRKSHRPGILSQSYTRSDQLREPQIKLAGSRDVFYAMQVHCKSKSHPPGIIPWEAMKVYMDSA